MINKRNGFKPRGINVFTVVPHANVETFDPTFQFRPFKLYQITTEDGKYAITGEKETNSVFLSTPNKNNKYQWLLIDSDTGAICFFTDLLNYMSIDMALGVVNVKRSDVLLKGLFNFKANNTITLKEHPKHCLAFTLLQAEKPKAESFIESFIEFFNPATEPALEVVELAAVEANPGKYSNTWKYVELMDLRTLTDNADTIKELEAVGDANDKQILLLKRKVENANAMAGVEISYRDNKIKGYEDHWFIKHFLK